MIERLDVQTVTESEVALAFSLRDRLSVEATLKSVGHAVSKKTLETENVGRLTLDNLLPDTMYRLTVTAGDGEPYESELRTLPAPQGDMVLQFAVLADVHVTRLPELRKGRLLPEAAAILREIVAEVNRNGVDFVLMPGDITNDGIESDFTLAKEILSALHCDVLAVPGDHDVKEAWSLYEAAFGSSEWTCRRGPLTIIGCRAAREMGPKGRKYVASALESAEGQVVLLGHRQFVPDGYIVDDDRVIADHEAFVSEVLPHVPPGTVAYIGHKNVPSHLRAGSLFQLNAPQSVQYPCGYLLVRCYENGMYHNFRPIFSEILNDVSRIHGNSLKDPKWNDSYRRGKGYNLWNFVHNPGVPPQLPSAV